MARKTDVDRRGLLRGDWLRSGHEQRTSYALRPPGALDERLFPTACDGCSACAAACPHKVIYMTGPPAANSEATPELFVDVSPCRLCQDLPCIAACEPGALRPVTRAEVRIAKAGVLAERCWVVNGTDAGCTKCFDVCPLPGTAITQTPGAAPVIHEEPCTGCGLCYGECPVPGKAIQLSRR